MAASFGRGNGGLKDTSGCGSSSLGRGPDRGHTYGLLPPWCWWCEGDEDPAESCSSRWLPRRDRWPPPPPPALAVAVAERMMRSRSWMLLRRMSSKDSFRLEDGGEQEAVVGAGGHHH